MTPFPQPSTSASPPRRGLLQFEVPGFLPAFSFAGAPAFGSTSLNSADTRTPSTFAKASRSRPATGVTSKPPHEGIPKGDGDFARGAFPRLHRRDKAERSLAEITRSVKAAATQLMTRVPAHRHCASPNWGRKPRRRRDTNSEFLDEFSRIATQQSLCAQSDSITGSFAGERGATSI